MPAQTDFERAIAFEHALGERCAERIVPFRFGRAFFNDSYRAVWDLNGLLVEEPADATAGELAAEADRLQGAAGHRHRRVAVTDEQAGAALAEDFDRLGWRALRFLLMAWRGSGARAVDTAGVEELADAAPVRPLREAISRAEPWGTDDDVVRMVVEAAELAASRARGRHFAVRVNGEVVSAADLYSDGRTAQVEDVATSAAHRGRGHASAVVLRAVAEAHAAGHDLVFLVSDAEDWPKELYARLGFEPLGCTWSFLRSPS